MGFITNNTAFTVYGNCYYTKSFNWEYYNKKKNYKAINKGIAITSQFSWEVYHSTIESLPKLMPFYVNKSIITNYTIIITHSKYKMNPVLEILKMLNFDISQIDYTPIIVKELIIPFPSSCLQAIEGNVKILNKLLTNRISSNLTEKRKVLIIKRNNRRMFPNFSLLVKMIGNVFYKYTTAIYDDNLDYKYRDILLMFYEASIVIGAHGAGLSNIIACRSKTMIIEIAIEGNLKCFSSLSHQLDMIYIKYVFNKTERNGNIKYYNIDISDFQSFLHRIIGSV